MRSPRGFSVKYTSRVNILRRGLRGSHHIHVAADTDTLFTLHEPAQILRQVERATKVFSQYPPPSHGGKGGRERGAKQGWEMWERERVDSQYSGVALVEKEEGGRKEGGGRGSEYEPKEYEPYVRRARYKLWAATCMRVITYRDLTVSSQVKHRLVRRVAR